jgi:uncharacterized Zn ribbon protein
VAITRQTDPLPILQKIRLTGNPEEVDGRVDGMKIALKTCFVKKA